MTTIDIEAERSKFESVYSGKGIDLSRHFIYAEQFANPCTHEMFGAWLAAKRDAKEQGNG